MPTLESLLLAVFNHLACLSTFPNREKMKALQEFLSKLLAMGHIKSPYCLHCEFISRRKKIKENQKCGPIGWFMGLFILTQSTISDKVYFPTNLVVSDASRGQINEHGHMTMRDANV